MQVSIFACLFISKRAPEYFSEHAGNNLSGHGKREALCCFSQLDKNPPNTGRQKQKKGDQLIMDECFGCVQNKLFLFQVITDTSGIVRCIRSKTTERHLQQNSIINNMDEQCSCLLQILAFKLVLENRHNWCNSLDVVGRT